jgi:Cupin-like domain
VNSATTGGSDNAVTHANDITLEQFQAEFLDQEPVIMRFATPTFPALSQWDASYLRDRFADREVVAYENRTHATFSQGDDFSEEVSEVILPFSTLIDEIFDHVGGSDRRLYLRVRFRDEGNLEMLTDHLVLPPLFSTDLDMDKSGVWIGHGGNRTPLHSDSWEGILGQVCGSKAVHVFPPSAGPALARLERAIRAYPGPMTQLMDGWEEVREIDHYSCTVAPGDALYIPPSWFHDVESLDASVSLVFRF